MPRRAHWVYVGDSTNDQLMFGHFPLSVGVANLMRFADRADDLAGVPDRSGERGAGFAEVADGAARARGDDAARRRAAVDAGRRRGAGARRCGVARPRALLVCAAAAADARRPRLELSDRRRDEHRQCRRLSAGALLLPRVLRALRCAHGAARRRRGAGAAAGAARRSCSATRALFGLRFADRRGERGRVRGRRRCSPRGSARRRRQGAARSRPASCSASTTAAPASASWSRRCSCRPLAARAAAHAWQWAWIALGAPRCVATALTARRPRRRRARRRSARRAAAPHALRLAPFALGLAAYFLFGLGYIGYMTFVITLLREQRPGRAGDRRVLRAARPRR